MLHQHTLTTLKTLKLPGMAAAFEDLKSSSFSPLRNRYRSMIASGSSSTGR